MGRRAWILITALLVLLPIADTTLWYLAERRQEEFFDTWVLRGKAAGWTVTGGRRVMGGWPLTATLTISDVLVKGGAPVIAGGLSWHAPSLTLRVSLTQPRTLQIAAHGDQSLRLGGGPEVTITADRLLAVLNLNAGTALRDMNILAHNPRAFIAPDADSAWSVSARQADCHLDVNADAGQDEPAVSFSFTGRALALPPSIKWPLGRTIASLQIVGDLEGPVPAAQPLASWAGAWRDAGGSLELSQVNLSWGPLAVAASATVALDDQLQPMGAGTSRLVGYAAAFDGLADSGALTHSAVTAAKAVLSLLAGTPGEGDQPDVDVPLTLQYRTLSMRQVPLLRLPEIDWPGQ